MSEDIKLHFGGLWAVVGEPVPERGPRTAIHFFGDSYMVFLDFERPNKFSQDMHHYVLGDGELWLQRLDSESKEEQPIVHIEWRLLETRFLRFEQDNGKYSVWEPVTAEQLADEGFPPEALESVRQAFLEADSSYSVAPLVPDKSAFLAAARQSRKK